MCMCCERDCHCCSLVPSRAVPPVFLDSPQSATVDELSNITLTCRASGNPAPTITWSRNDGTAYVRTDTLDSGVSVDV